jgi:predicted SAM-dependent methyltransferase
MVKFNLGCGYSKYEGFINIDISDVSSPDIICDLEKGLPFKDDCADEIVANHVIEHLTDTIFIMNEIWRVCKHTGIVNIEVPHQASKMAFADPTHKRVFNEESFKYFCSKGEHYWIHKSYGIYCNFELVGQKINTHKRYGYVRVKLRAIKTSISEKDNFTTSRRIPRSFRARSFLTNIFRIIYHRIVYIAHQLIIKKLKGGIQ